MTVLAIETSTSSAKAMAYDAKEGVKRVISMPYAQVAAKGTQNAHDVYMAAIKAARDAARGFDVEAIALSDTWHNVGIFNRHAEPITDLYTWECTQSAAECAKTRMDAALTNELYSRTGCMPHAIYPRSTLIHLRNSGFDFTGRLFLSQGSYNFYKMTGIVANSINAAGGSGLLNLSGLDYDDMALRMAGINKSQLPPVTDYKKACPLSKEAALAIGVEAGIPVVPPHADGALNQIGSGSSVPGLMTLSVGTSAAIRMSVEKPTLPAGRELWCYPGVSGYLLGAATSGACNCVNWFKDRVLHGNLSFEKLETDAIPDNPPIFLPFLFGERCPGWSDVRTAGFMDITGNCNVTDMYFSMLSGVLYNLNQCYSPLVATASEPDKILVSGGILMSKMWTAMLSDILGREVALCECKDASLLGASALALFAAGAIEAEAFPPVSQNAATVSPRPERYKYHQIQYGRYLKFYNMM